MSGLLIYFIISTIAFYTHVLLLRGKLEAKDCFVGIFVGPGLGPIWIAYCIRYLIDRML